MLIRLRAAAADASAARLMAERLADDRDESTVALATSAFEEPGLGIWYVDAYYASAPALIDIVARIGELIDPDRPPVIEEVPDENWVAVSQAALPPVGAGRFLVHGAHDRDLIGRRLFAIEIDAGEAFGTAHHATTQGCLEAIDRLARRRTFARVLDLGCGSGLLAIAAARVWPRAGVVASDIDPIAVDVARANARLNGAGTRIRFVAASGLDHPRLRDKAPYDLVLANILAGPLIRLAPRLARAVGPGGTAVLSGILGEQAREVIGAYAMAGFRLMEKRIDHNWATMVLVRCSGRFERHRPDR
ncbi:MAG: 50S ribosomal protein L11 methyltransferase [Hyphomicrobiaceae bacterium]